MSDRISLGAVDMVGTLAQKRDKNYATHLITGPGGLGCALTLTQEHLAEATRVGVGTVIGVRGEMVVDDGVPIVNVLQLWTGEPARTNIPRSAA